MEKANVDQSSSSVVLAVFLHGSCGGMRYETVEILSPFMVKRNLDTGIVCWWRFGFYHLYQQPFYCGRYCASRAYGRDRIYPAPVFGWFRLLHSLCLRFCFLCVSQNADPGASAFTFSAESAPVSGNCSRNRAFIDSSI